MMSPRGTKDKQEGEAKGFGAYLKEGRLIAGFSVDEVAKGLFISKETLCNIEQEDHSKLPESVFVAGFVKSYADFLGLRAERALLLYKESYKRWMAIEEEALHRERRREYVKAWLKGGFSTFFLIFLFTLSGLGLIHFFVLDKSETAPEENTAGQVVYTQGAPAQRRLHLEVAFSDANWLKIMVDGDSPKYYVVVSGERLEFGAEKNYNILIGNPAGVDLRLNDKHVPVFGTGGQAVALFLP